jgi:glycosyltransferase involved in cell wall biosynthesis
MIKICFFSLNIYSLFDSKCGAPVGGTEVQSYNSIRYLSENNIAEVSVITGNWGQKKVEKYGNVAVYRSISLRRTVLNYLKAPLIIWHLLKKINADVYVASSWGVEIGLIALFCRINRKKFLYRTASSADCDGKYIKKYGWRGQIFKYGLENADVIIAQTEENKNLLQKNHNIDAVVIKNSFIVSDRPDDNIGMNGYILWVGRVEPDKQPELFLKIVKKFPDRKFLMIAPKQANHLLYFKRISNEADRIKNLTFIERIPFNEIQKYFNAAKILVCTSKYEGFPNVHIQSLLGGVPVVSLSINPDNYINDNNIGYCSKGNFDLMTDQIKKIISDSENWKEKSRNAYEYVKKNHNIQSIGKQWEELIKKLDSKA